MGLASGGGKGLIPKGIQSRPIQKRIYSRHWGCNMSPPLYGGNGRGRGSRAEELPQLLEFSDLKGCFHNHTTASDGRNTLEEMAEEADRRDGNTLGFPIIQNQVFKRMDWMSQDLQNRSKRLRAQ